MGDRGGSSPLIRTRERFTKSESFLLYKREGLKRSGRIPRQLRLAWNMKKIVMDIMYRKIKEEDKEIINDLYEKLLDNHGCNIGLGHRIWILDLGFSIYKKKNDSTYFLSKSLERNKKIREDGDLER